MHTKSNLRGRDDGYLNVWPKGPQVLNRTCKPLPCGRFIAAMDQPRRQVAAIADLPLHQQLLALIEFVKLPLGGFAVEVGHALAGQGRTFRRDEQLETL